LAGRAGIANRMPGGHVLTVDHAVSKSMPACFFWTTGSLPPPIRSEWRYT
jgi:hypothetical protein